MENGRSISVSRMFLPGKSNFAMAHAAATPKTQLSGTEIPAAINVNLIALNVIGSRSV